jgi:predicted nucleotidyltransferase
MYPHHEASIQRVTDYFAAQPEVQALLLGGSIAHGYESATSDVDIAILVSETEHEQRLREGRLQFYSRDLVTYPEGYVDGKYQSMSFLRQVAEKGSDPARFAFAGSRILFSRIADLEPTLQRITRYPLEQKLSRIQRFYAQLEAWYWYVGEALRLSNRYLLNVSMDKLVLFSGRLLLTHNELFYPYHKWFLRVLADAPHRPADLLERINALYANPCTESAQELYECVRNYRAWEVSTSGWPNQFMLDSELNWLDGHTPIDDL